MPAAMSAACGSYSMTSKLANGSDIVPDRDRTEFYSIEKLDGFEVKVSTDGTVR